STAKADEYLVHHQSDFVFLADFLDLRPKVVRRNDHSTQAENGFRDHHCRLARDAPFDGVSQCLGRAIAAFLGRPAAEAVAIEVGWSDVNNAWESAVGPKTLLDVLNTGQRQR